MQVELRGWVSVDVDGEKLFEGETMAARLVGDVPDDEITIEDGTVRMQFEVPVQLEISEDEWLRAVVERLLQRVLEGVEPDRG